MVHRLVTVIAAGALAAGMISVPGAAIAAAAPSSIAPSDPGSRGAAADSRRGPKARWAKRPPAAADPMGDVTPPEEPRRLWSWSQYIVRVG